MLWKTVVKQSAEHTVAQQAAAYQNQNKGCCVVHDGVQFRCCCAIGGQRDRRYTHRWIYAHSAKVATSETETFSDRNIWNGLYVQGGPDKSAGRLGNRCDNDDNKGS